MSKLHGVIGLALASWALASCGAGGPSGDGDAGGDGAGDGAVEAGPLEGGAAVDVERPTYTEHVRPMLTRACVGCHSAGQIAPFVLDSYAAAAPRAALIAREVRARRMPPYLVDNSGACGTFRDVPRMSEAEMALLERWAAQGAPEGDPSIPAPVAPEVERLRGEVHSIDTGVSYVPRVELPDDYRCFIAEAPVAAGSYYVTGFDVRPGERRVVHHVIVYHPQNDSESARARALDAAEAGAGYTCFGAAGVTAAAVAAWAPGGGATHFPSGLGVQLAGGRPLVIQVHYNTQAGALPDRTAVDLEVRTSGVLPGRFAPMADPMLSLPPRTRDATAGLTVSLADRPMFSMPLRVYGVFPHMHTLGRSLRLDVLRADGSRECIVDVPRWDFHWQRLYFHERPVRLNPTDSLSIQCRYDTTGRDTTTVWGEGTADEMCVTGVFVSL